MISKTKLSTWQLVLISTGGMLGAGWLFSPYYGFQTAGVGVLLSWAITAILTMIIGLSFIEIYTLLPIVGGVPRFIGISYNRNLAFIFMGFSWLSYVVYLPLEAQSAIQYLGFWWSDLITNTGGRVELSGLGICLAFLIILGLTWFNTFFISHVAKLNSIISIGKLLIPVCVVTFLIVKYGKWDNVINNFTNLPFSYENVLLAITSSGLAFAFTGFQNGLILANSAKNYKKAIPYSVFSPIIFGGAIYFCLSLAFIACLPADKHLATTAVAPLLGLVAMFSAHILFTVLFIDAISAPLGTANVYTAVTGRILYGLGRDFFPNSILTKLNNYSSPHIALWISGIVGMCCLLPFPTWKELVDFLSSIVVFSYLAGPISLIILRNVLPDHQRVFKVKYYKLIGYLGFACCSLLIYWSGLNNLIYLSLLIIIAMIGYGILIKSSSIIMAFCQSWYIVLYMVMLAFISYLRSKNLINFPYDNIFVLFIGLTTCKIMLNHSLYNQQIIRNVELIQEELA